MSKRKLETASGMHPSNPYHDNPPDFVALAEQYPSLKPYVTVNALGLKARGSINFRDPKALRELTYCLLRRDFSIELDIPIDSLCPTVPNRVNYVCWIEDLMKNDSKSPVYGIDIGTGASCIYPLLGCIRNKNWKMAATDVDDRSIDFATKNVAKNNLQQVIKIIKNPSSQIFPELLFKDGAQTYDFCMCNPPFYEDELDIQEGFEGKEDRPSAVCQGTSNEMMTTGGEVQFIKQMVDESHQWDTRIRWYTSMLGKKNSVDKITTYLKERKIFNYTLTTFRQGRTTRWAVAWSFGDEHPSWASMQHTSAKMIKLTPATTVLSFSTSDITAEVATTRATSLLDQLYIGYSLDNSVSTKESEGTWLFHGSVKANTWSRSARRALARDVKDKDMVKDGSKISTKANASDLPTLMGFDLRVLPASEESGTAIASNSQETAVGLTVHLTWTIGHDRDLFESFFLHFRSRFLSPIK